MKDDIEKVNLLLKHISTIGSVYADYVMPFAHFLAELEASHTERVSPADPVLAEGLTDIPNGVYYSAEPNNGVFAKCC